MVNLSLLIFSLISIFLSAVLFYFDHMIFGIVFLISDLVVFLTIKAMSKSTKEPKIDFAPFCFTFVAALIISHFAFRGYYSWEEFQPWAAVRNVQLSGGGEILLAFSVCVVLISIIHRKLGVHK